MSLFRKNVDRMLIREPVALDADHLGVRLQQLSLLGEELAQTRQGLAQARTRLFVGATAPEDAGQVLARTRTARRQPQVNQQGRGLPGRRSEFAVFFVEREAAQCSDAQFGHCFGFYAYFTVKPTIFDGQMTVPSHTDHIAGICGEN